jgi:hypothetical protein
MKFASKIVGLCLVVTLIAAFAPANDAWAEVDRAPHSLAVPVESAASCHARGGSESSESQRPLSYRCCMTGHDVAVVQASQSPRPIARCVRVVSQVEPGLTESTIRAVDGSIILSAYPPSTSPLRI